MKKSILAVLVTLAGIWYLFGRARSVIDRLRFTIAGISGINITNEPGAVFLLQVSNPTNAAVYMKNVYIHGNIILNGLVDLGTVEAFINDILLPGKSITIPIQFDFSKNLNRAVLVAAVALLQSGGVVIDFDGSIVTTGIEFPLKIKNRLS